MLIATAGHVDHGKTSLVRCLTGVDTDRLPQEKARGLTIEAGFVYQDLAPDVRVGFVDVPGHERFVRNMLAGVAAVDAAILVVAADDGPMPQTREHLDVLRLLGMMRGFVVITKTDRVDAARLARVRADIQTMIGGSFLELAPMLAVSAVSGDGIEALRAGLLEVARQHSGAASSGRFRLAIDRAFVVEGAGQIVTGAIFSGQVSVGDELCLTPSGEPVRVRSLHVQDMPVQTSPGIAGQRCAVALTGPALNQRGPGRGDWLVGAPTPLPSARLDVRIGVLSTSERALRHWTAVHVHHGAAMRTGRIALLQGRELEPGATALAQLVLDEPVVAVRGDRFIVRDQSARRTLAGGVILDPFGAAKGRARTERLAVLNAMAIDDPARALQARLELETGGTRINAFTQALNLRDDESVDLLAAVDARSVDLRGGRVLVTRTRWDALESGLLEAVARWHEEYPESAGPRAERLRTDLTQQGSGELTDACIASLVRARRLILRSQALALPGYKPVVSPEDLQRWGALQAELGPAQWRPPTLADLARRSGCDQAELEGFMQRMVLNGALVRVRPNRYFHHQAVAALAAVAERLAAGAGADYDSDSFDARGFREAAGIGRNISIEVLEYFDAQRFTRRLGDRRVVLRPAREIFGS